jgi:hypothetical protein
VNGNVPAVVGVPDSNPVPAANVTPGGNDPALTDHTYGDVPPTTASESVYAAPTSAAGGAGLARLGDTFGVTAADIADAGPDPPALVAVTVNVYAVPAVRPVTVCVVVPAGNVWGV